MDVSVHVPVGPTQTLLPNLILQTSSFSLLLLKCAGYTASISTQLSHLAPSAENLLGKPLTEVPYVQAMRMQCFARKQLDSVTLQIKH